MSDTKRLTSEDLAQIQERASIATEGKPLKIGFNGEIFELYDVDGEWIADVGVSDVAQFISDAYEDIPKLLAEIDRLEDTLYAAYQEIRRSKYGRAIDIIEEWGDNE